MLEIIKELIASRREGDFWDFKENHHENKALLLHDILCLANSLTKTNKYLIYGVSDPIEGCEIKGVSDGNRRNQTDIIDFLRSKNFAGDIRPEIELRTLADDDQEIDILIIYDHPRKPYYLVEDYRDRDKVVKANHIYTRNLDTNTPINKSADLLHVVSMWRERFGLDLQPAQKMLELLMHPDEWDKDIGNKEFAYHKYFPEYQVRFGEVREFKDVYSYFYINERSFIGTASFNYLATELFSLQYIYCDEMRIELAAPENGWIQIEGREIWYMYYELNSRKGAFLHFMTNGTYDFQCRGRESIFVLFRDKDERKEFESYLMHNIDKLDSIPDSDFGILKQQRIDKSKDNFVFKPVEMIKVQTLFQQWQKR